MCLLCVLCQLPEGHMRTTPHCAQCVGKVWVPLGLMYSLHLHLAAGHQSVVHTTPHRHTGTCTGTGSTFNTGTCTGKWSTSKQRKLERNRKYCQCTNHDRAPLSRQLHITLTRPQTHSQYTFCVLGCHILCPRLSHSVS